MNQPKYVSPIAKNSRANPTRKLRDFQVGQVPHNCVTNGLSAPPTIPLVNP